MKKATSKRRAAARPAVVPDDEILPEYDFSRARRNPYAVRFRAGVVVVQLDPDVAAVYPDAVAQRQPKKPSSRRRTA
jgi:hypothetical protein